ncbi:MAG: ribose ABC transporter permease, partial [Oscillospiraceae bacterium]|nr:ribose ABC transporter permease [Oscillospiraceae bacterium]
MLKKIFKKKEIGILLIIIAVCIIITAVNPAFLRLDNITTVITTNEVLGICALGMLLVMLTGGIDVSIGWLVTSVAVVIGWASATFGLNLPVLIIIAMITGGILGSLNGLIIA